MVFLTAFRTHRRGGLHAGPRAWSVVSVVCLVLLALLAVVQIAHIHPTESDADHCQLCIVMHTAAPIAVMAAVVVLVQIETAAPVFKPRTVVRYWHPQALHPSSPSRLLADVHDFQFSLTPVTRCSFKPAAKRHTPTG